MGMFDMDPSDMALSSIPGQDNFDPRRHRFSEDELKPQPMIKKARKMLVPEDLKVSMQVCSGLLLVAVVHTSVHVLEEFNSQLFSCISEEGGV